MNVIFSSKLASISPANPKVIFKVMRYRMRHQLNIAMKHYPSTTSFFKTPLLRQFIWEIFFNMIHPSPFLQGMTYETYNSTVQLFITYEMNDILSAFSAIRIYYILK